MRTYVMNLHRFLCANRVALPMPKIYQRKVRWGWLPRTGISIRLEENWQVCCNLYDHSSVLQASICSIWVEDAKTASSSQAGEAAHRVWFQLLSCRIILHRALHGFQFRESYRRSNATPSSRGKESGVNEELNPCVRRVYGRLHPR